MRPSGITEFIFRAFFSEEKIAVIPASAIVILFILSCNRFEPVDHVFLNILTSPDRQSQSKQAGPHQRQ